MKFDLVLTEPHNMQVDIVFTEHHTGNMQVDLVLTEPHNMQVDLVHTEQHTSNMQADLVLTEQHTTNMQVDLVLMEQHNMQVDLVLTEQHNMYNIVLHVYKLHTESNKTTMIYSSYYMIYEDFIFFTIKDRSAIYLVKK